MTPQLKSWPRVLLESWDQFWFKPGDPTTLGLMRICTGVLVFWILFAYTADLQEFMGKNAWISQEFINRVRDREQGAPKQFRAYTWDDPIKPGDLPPMTPEEREYYEFWKLHPHLAFLKGFISFSIWYHVSDPTAMTVIHYCILGIAVLFTLGLFTRITSVLLWAAVVSYTQRSPATVFGMDTMMNILLIYLMIGPSGAALSLDRLLARWWEARQARRDGLPVPHWAPPAPLVSANFTIRMIQIHLCIIYFIAGAAKLKGNAWWAHTAVWGTMINAAFCPVHVKPYLAFLQYLSNHRPLWELWMTLSAGFTLFMELGFAFLVWNKNTRWLMIICAVLLHLGIAFFMGLTLFSSLMLCLVLSFVPVDQIHRLLRLLRVERAESRSMPAPRSGELDLVTTA